MTDREVGELWREWRSGNPKIIALIRKLVEERAQNHFWSSGKGKTVKDFDNQALLDFGIDPDEFK